MLFKIDGLDMFIVGDNGPLFGGNLSLSYALGVLDLLLVLFGLSDNTSFLSASGNLTIVALSNCFSVLLNLFLEILLMLFTCLTYGKRAFDNSNY